MHYSNNCLILDDITPHWIYSGQPWGDKYYFRVTRRVDSQSLQSGDLVTSKNFIGQHTVLMIKRNKSFNKVLLSNPTESNVVECKFNEVDKPTGTVSDVKLASLKYLFHDFLAQKVFKYQC